MISFSIDKQYNLINATFNLKLSSHDDFWSRLKVFELHHFACGQSRGYE